MRILYHQIRPDGPNYTWVEVHIEDGGKLYKNQSRFSNAVPTRTLLEHSLEDAVKVIARSVVKEYLEK